MQEHGLVPGSFTTDVNARLVNTKFTMKCLCGAQLFIAIPRFGNEPEPYIERHTRNAIRHGR